jgi:hypothetical protein
MTRLAPSELDQYAPAPVTRFAAIEQDQSGPAMGFVIDVREQKKRPGNAAHLDDRADQGSRSG